MQNNANNTKANINSNYSNHCDDNNNIVIIIITMKINKLIKQIITLQLKCFVVKTISIEIILKNNSKNNNCNQ